MKDEKGDTGKKSKSLNVLVADDDEGMCKMFTKWLSADGHKVKTAFTGEEAFDFVKKEYFNLVFLDVIMPGRPILIVLDEIKRISQGTQVVMITGRLLDGEFKEELRQKGASQLLQKPFSIVDIDKCLASIGE